MATAFVIADHPVRTYKELELSLPNPSLPEEGKGYLVYNFVDHDEEMDAEITVSFFWDGDPDHLVVVAPSEGEMPVYGFKLRMNFTPLSAQETIREFQLVCDKWIVLVLPTLRGVIR
jgi:hypothetical protein